jgi:hypothetical protein
VDLRQFNPEAVADRTVQLAACCGLRPSFDGFLQRILRLCRNLAMNLQRTTGLRGRPCLRRAEGVAADPDPHAELGDPPLDHAAGVSSLCIASLVGSPGATDGEVEEGRLGVVASTGRLVERCLLTSSSWTKGLGDSEVVRQPNFPMARNHLPFPR